MTRSPMEPQPTIKDWLTRHPVTLVVLAGPYESVDDDGWKHDAYRLRLVWGGPSHTPEKRQTPEFAYRMGVGHRTTKYNRRTAMQDKVALPTPPLPDVLDSLISDASCYEDAHDFQDFAGNLGYDSDSRKAEALYRACGEVYHWLTAFVGGRSEMAVLFGLERL